MEMESVNVKRVQEKDVKEVKPKYGKKRQSK
jgi:hypothetical protein